ncbi:unnamed protein product [marine sediment metagenome]|uniref:Uncharacterized protein n=1 Tax=marine sediment metagenome TaxID=412755 RepID=X0U1U1_9ZZZZ
MRREGAGTIRDDEVSQDPSTRWRSWLAGNRQVAYCLDLPRANEARAMACGEDPVEALPEKAKGHVGGDS